MNKILKHALVAFFLLTNISLVAKNYTVIVSLDGFRYDYPEKHGAKNIEAIGDKGVKAIMRPSYPSSTFPNHYTLITGLVPDHHGIVNNSFYDRENKRQYAIYDSLTRNDTNYYKGETIWATAKKQGVRTGSLYWLGSDLPINGIFPAYYKVWAEEPRLSFDKRIEEALTWLALPEKDRPELITLYMEEPDGSGHKFGPLGEGTKKSVHYVDSLIGVLYQGIQKLPFADKVNLIITSDHGMTDISTERFINIDDVLPKRFYQRAVGGNPTSIYADAHQVDSIYAILSEVDHIEVYKKDEMPAEYNYGTNKNIGDIIVVPELGWQFGYKAPSILGAHGYPVRNAEMHVIFRAVGPDFKDSYKGSTFDNTAIYPLLCYLLNIKPSTNDGNLQQVKAMLKKK